MKSSPSLTILMVALLAAAELVVLNHWAFAHTALHDGGVILYGAERVANGQAPYRDFFHFFTPGSIVLLSGLYLTLGTNVASALLSVVLLGVGTALAVAILARMIALPFGWSAMAGWLGVNTAIVWWPTPSHHWFATLAALAGVLAAVAALRARSSWWAVAAGFTLAATCWFLQPRGVLTFLLVGGGLVAARRDTWRPLLVGALVAGLPSFVLIALVPAPAVWEQVVVFPLVNYPDVNRAPFMDLDLMPSALLVDGWRKVLQVIFQMSFLWLALPATLATLALALHRRSAAVALVALGAVAGIVSVLPRPLAGHVTFVAPLLVAPLLWVVLELTRRWRLARAVPVVLAAAHVLTFAPLHEGWLVATGQTVGVQTPRGMVPIGTADDAAGAAGALRPVSEYVLARTQPGEPIFVYPALPAYYFLLERPNPTAFDYLWPGENPPAHFHALEADLDRSPPRVAVRDHSVGQFYRPSSAGSPDVRDSAELMDRVFQRLYSAVFAVGLLEVLEAR